MDDYPSSKLATGTFEKAISGIISQETPMPLCLIQMVMEYYGEISPSTRWYFRWVSFRCPLFMIIDLPEDDMCSYLRAYIENRDWHIVHAIYEAVYKWGHKLPLEICVLYEYTLRQKNQALYDYLESRSDIYPLTSAEYLDLLYVAVKANISLDWYQRIEQKAPELGWQNHWGLFRDHSAYSDPLANYLYENFDRCDEEYPSDSD